MSGDTKTEGDLKYCALDCPVFGRLKAKSDAFKVGRSVPATEVCFLGDLWQEPFFALHDFEAAGAYTFVCIRLTVFLLFSRGAWNPR